MLLIVDAFSLAFRAYYAYPPSLRLENGTLVNAIFGFVTLLLKAMDEFKPSHVCICFDHPSPTFRHIDYAAYKAQRPRAPEDFVAQIAMLKALLTDLGFHWIDQPGFEADDLMGTLAKRESAQHRRVWVMTGDHDALQLVDDQVRVVMGKKSEWMVYDAAAVEALYGFEPALMVDYKALRGDASDNIPGVPGIGEKTAIALIQRFGSLGEVYANLDRVTPAGVQKKLLEGKELAFKSQFLARIDTQVPITSTWEDCEFNPNWEQMIALFRAYEFKSLVQKYQSRVALPLERAPAEATVEDSGIVELTPIQLTEKLDTLRAGFAVVWEGGIWGLATTDAAWMVAESAEVLALLRPLLRDQTVPKWVVDGKNLQVRLAWLGEDIAGIVFDAGLAAQVIDPTRSPEWLSAKVLPGQRARDVMAHMAGQKLELESWKLEALYADMELPLSRILAKMELEGIRLDTTYLAELRTLLESHLAEIRAKCFELAGMDFNLSSPKQLSEVLFDHLKLPVYKKTKTGRSTDSSVLEKLAKDYPIAVHLLVFRQLEKLLSTYVTTLPGMVNPKTGKIHTSYNQIGAATGRLSSVNPNLQNIPIRSEEGLAIRQAFVASTPENRLLSVDYSQIELRILAHITQDPHMIAAFARGEDIHTATAATVFHVPISEVTKAQRYQAKAVNFGIIYGMSSFGLSENLGIPAKEAQEIIDRYFNTFSKIKDFIAQTLGYAKDHRFVVTEFGRVRPVLDIDAPSFTLRQFAQRIAVNTRIQGTAADLIKLAMVKVDHALTAQGLKAKMILQVHDELVFDFPAEEEAALTALVQEAMISVVSWSVPLVVDIAVGCNWKEIS